MQEKGDTEGEMMGARKRTCNGRNGKRARSG